MARPLLLRGSVHLKRGARELQHCRGTVFVLFRRIAIDLSLGNQSVRPPFRQGGTRAGPAVQDRRFRGGGSTLPHQTPHCGVRRVTVPFLRHFYARLCPRRKPLTYESPPTV